MWLKLLTAYSIEINGTTRQCSPGDWIEVGNQHGKRLIADRVATVPNYSSTIQATLTGSGIAVENEEQVKVATAIGNPYGIKAIICKNWDHIPFERTLFLDTSANVPRELLPVGFHLLETWEVACPLLSYETLACNIGSVEQRAIAQAILHDLRVPLYDTRLLFVRQGEAGDRLLAEWAKQKASLPTELSFLTALYITKPLILALPVTWLDVAYDTHVQE